MIRAFGSFDNATSTRWLVHTVLYLDTIDFLGTEKHIPFIDKGYTLEEYGCYCMTELGHGSNVTGLETTATYDPSSREFIIHSPVPTSAKWWVGALANTADMAIVFSRLLVKGEDFGIHAFLIRIREKGTHNPI